MTQIDIPESLQFYYESSGNAEAIDTLVQRIQSNKDEAPEDMGWDDLATYHRALLAAYQCEVDLWLFYKALWEAIWEDAISELGGIESEPYKYEGELSLAHVWNFGICRMHELGNGYFCSYVESDTRAIRIAFYYKDENEQYARSNELVLNPAIWDRRAEDDTRCTAFDETPVRGLSTFDTASLREAAHEAVRQFKKDSADLF